MVDLEQLVEIKWHGTNKERYESFGYIFTKSKDQLFVMAKHLPNSSKLNIKITCDYCNNEITKRYIDYTESVKNSKSSKDCCTNCKGVKINRDNPNSGKKCQAINSIRKEFENRNLLLTSTEYTKKGQPLYFICNKHNNETQSIKLNSLKRSQFGCKYCATECTAKKISGENTLIGKVAQRKLIIIFVTLYLHGCQIA